MNNNMFGLKLSLDQGTHGIFIFSFYRKTKRQKCFTKTGCWEEMYCYKVKANNISIQRAKIIWQP